MAFSGKTWLMTILKVTKTRVLLFLQKTHFCKNHMGEGGDGQIDTPSLIRVKQCTLLGK